MLRHVEGDLDGERARVLRCIDDGNDTRADGDQSQGDLVQRTVEVAWRKGSEGVGENTGGGVKLFVAFGIFARRRLSERPAAQRGPKNVTRQLALFPRCFPQPLQRAPFNSAP